MTAHQNLAAKVAAIATVLFLLEDHHRMIAMGRTVPRAQWVSSGAPDAYRPPSVIPPDPHDPAYPDEAFIVRQRQVSRAYRLWSISLALQSLWCEHPKQAQAVECRYINIPPTGWVEPDTQVEFAAAGLRFIASRVPGDVPVYQPAPVHQPKPREAKREMVAEMLGRGCTYVQIMRDVGCSSDLVAAVSCALKVRSESAVSAGS